jgi:hypothetical protein
MLLLESTMVPSSVLKQVESASGHIANGNTLSPMAEWGHWLYHGALAWL